MIGLQGQLGASQVLRIHSGRQVPVSMLHAEDRQGADFHALVGRDLYVWNNAEGDCSGLWSRAAHRFVDKACYEPYPPEGVILVTGRRQASSIRGARVEVASAERDAAVWWPGSASCPGHRFLSN